MAGLTSGQIFAGIYEVGKKIGMGGTRSVYSAEDLLRPTRRKIALKVLHESLQTSPIVGEDILSKTELWKKARHPALLAVNEAGAYERDMVWETELVEGVSLSAMLKARGTLTWEEARPVLLQCSEGLGALHQVGLIHSDMKPSKILLSADMSSAKVSDTSLLRLADGPDPLTEKGIFIGTPRYACPEAVSIPRRYSYDRRADVFALGVIMHEMLSGNAPFKGETVLETLIMIRDGEPQPLGPANPPIPAAVEKIVTRALQKNPACRFQSMEELREAILRA